ncbi:MAG TPA: UDP-GlcNAc--UDP-phosphate GlcNAc-1-phosphate transferase, partial [Cyclobacteriaceae bacterium]|nr:UDP-GlcNAc--UDP-phosphate GlcNAc-1-phosphate transferase [Cyclobacteriaceae bacterium]
MNTISWFLFAIVLLGLELIYFRIARTYKILDHPNNRNLHIQPTIRGGGVVFFFTAVLYYLISHEPSGYTMAGLALVSCIGFVDDVRSLSSTLRFVLQMTSLGFMFYGFNQYPDTWMVVILFIISVGALNAFNFMDGINGLTGGYSLIALGTLAYI